jgi:hypothetical protein
MRSHPRLFAVSKIPSAAKAFDVQRRALHVRLLSKPFNRVLVAALQIALSNASKGTGAAP